jgi:hypothetical protein
MPAACWYREIRGAGRADEVGDVTDGGLPVTAERPTTASPTINAIPAIGVTRTRHTIST